MGETIAPQKLKARSPKPKAISLRLCDMVEREAVEFYSGCNVGRRIIG